MWNRSWLSFVLCVFACTVYSERFPCKSPSTKILSSYGEVSSPNYPNNYTDNLDCRWTLKFGKTDKMFLQVKDLANGVGLMDVDGKFDRIHCFDKLAIYSQKGDGVSVIPNGRLCGFSISDLNQTTFTITGTEFVEIRFTSDKLETNRGFLIDFTIDCNHNFTGESGMITSPRYPKEYSANATCVTNIIGPLGTKIVITLRDIDIKEKSGYCDDSLIIDGQEYCGKAIPEPIVIRSEKTTVVFKSNHKGNGRGFSAEWKAVPIIVTTTAPPSARPFVPVGCNVTTSQEGQYAVASPGYPDNFPPNTNCITTVKIPPTAEIHLYAEMHISTREGLCAEDNSVLLTTENYKRRRCGRVPFKLDILNTTYIKFQFTSDNKGGDWAFLATWELASLETAVSGETTVSEDVTALQATQTSSSFPTWAIYVCIGIGALLLILLLIFFLQRRRMYGRIKGNHDSNGSCNNIASVPAASDFEHHEPAMNSEDENPYHVAKFVTVQDEPLYASVDENIIPEEKAGLQGSKTEAHFRPLQAPDLNMRRLSARQSLISVDSFDTLDSFEDTSHKDTGCSNQQDEVKDTNTSAQPQLAVDAPESENPLQTMVSASPTFPIVPAPSNTGFEGLSETPSINHYHSIGEQSEENMSTSAHTSAPKSEDDNDLEDLCKAPIIKH